MLYLRVSVILNQIIPIELNIDVFYGYLNLGDGG